MIPISLTLKGIYSYKEGEQTIDFTNLCNAGLFGIFGSVGSGKSTILEAISYALYGETERLNQREKRSYNMMNLKSDNLLIDFEFRNIRDNEIYRFVVKGKRNSKRFEDVKSLERFAFKKVEGEWQPLPSSNAKPIIGLNYDNFRRTTIIPQGKFQEFLQLGSSERTKMMKELFDLQKFDFSDRIKKIEQENNFKRNNIQGQLYQLEDISEDKIKQINAELSSINTELKKNIKEQKQLQNSVDELSKLKEVFDKLVIIKSEYEKLKKQEPEIEQLKLKHEEYLDCVNKFRSKIDKINNDLQKLQKLQKTLEQSNREYERLKLLLQEASTKFDKLKPKFDSKEALKQTIDDYSNIIIIKQLHTQIEKLINRKKEGEKIINKTISEILNFTNKQKELKKKIRDSKENEIDIAKLFKIKDWFKDLHNLQNSNATNQLELSEKTNEKDKLYTQIAGILAKVKINSEKIESGYINKIFEEQIAYLELAENQINDKKTQLMLKKGLTSYSENLKEGDECPVCGSVHHPKKMLDKDLSEQLIASDKKLQEIKQKNKDTKNIQQEFNIQYSHNENIKKQIQKIVSKQEKINSELDNLRNSYNFDIEYTEKELDLEFEKAKQQKEMLAQQELELEKTENSLNKAIKNKEKYQNAIDDINRQIEAQKVEAATIKKHIKLSNIEEHLSKDIEFLKEEILEKNQEYTQIIENYNLLNKQIDKLTPETSKLKGVIETKTSDKTKLEAECAKEQHELNNLAQSSKYQSVETVSAILKEDLDTEKSNKKIREFENNYFSIKNKLNELQDSVKDKQFKPDEFIKLQADLKACKNTIDQQNKTIGFKERKKQEQEKKLIEKTNLEDELEKLNLRHDNIKTLKNLFQGSGFVNYISRVYLQNLVLSANQRFTELTQQKLHLELSETNDFQIRDHLNGGEIRSVKTLSGGQTFQAALSLALALTDNIQKTSDNGNNFFFLDEGFGALDKDALAIVFQSLKSLRKENRIVGVISHVEDLQNEMDNYLYIKNDEEKGSIIYNSWENIS